MANFFLNAAPSIIGLFLLSTSVFGQDLEIENRYLELIQGPFARYEDPIQKTNEILDLAEQVARGRGINVSRETVTVRSGRLREQPVLRILVQGDSAANREARAIHRSMGGVKLLLSPYSLKRSGANAFFSPDGSMIGVPRQFLLNQMTESYFHEKQHAQTYLDLIQGRADRYAGWLKLLSGSRMSTRAAGGYIRFFSIDEIKTTEFSAQQTVEELYRRFKTQSQNEFLRSRANEELLLEAHHNLKNLVGLARQIEDVMGRTAGGILSGDHAVRRTRVRLGGTFSRRVFEIKLLTYSVDRIFERGRGINIKVEGGTEVVLRALTRDATELAERCRILSAEAMQTAEKYQRALGLVSMRITRPELVRTDVGALWRAVH